MSNATYTLSGELNFTNVMSVYRDSIRQLNQCAEWTFDFSQLKCSNSAGLALIIEWIKLAKQRNKPINFIAIPVSLLSIAKAAGIDGFIVLSDKQ